MHLTSMTHSMVLRPAAENAMDLKTTFRWRHRFPEVMNNDQAEELCGITELDETSLMENLLTSLDLT